MVVLITVMVLFANAVPLSADDGRGLSVFGGFGFALNDFKGFCLVLGTEIQINEKFYAQFLLDYYPSAGEKSVEGAGNSVYGINLYGVFKQPISERLKLFAKAGVHYTVMEGASYFWGMYFTEAQSKFGVGAGFGAEYDLNEKLSLLLGATVKLIFADETGTWIKIYSGVSYHLQ